MHRIQWSIVFLYIVRLFVKIANYLLELGVHYFLSEELYQIPLVFLRKAEDESKMVW